MNIFKASLFFAPLIGVCFSSNAQSKKLILKSTVSDVSYQVGNQNRSTWSVDPKLHPDVLGVECKTLNTRVVFKSDLDSLVFNVNVKDTINFYIVLNNRDSAFTQIVGKTKNANFSDAYVKANKGKFTVEVPEVHELANIIVALSKVGQLDSNMVDMNTTYYKKVMQHFATYKNHPLIDTVNKHITEVLENNSYMYYYGLKMAACAYKFDQNGHLFNEGIVRRMGFGNSDLIEGLTGLLEDFSKKSGFRSFYKENQGYYKELITVYQELNPIVDMQKWLETKFKHKYGSYRITFSPLVDGAHATERFEDNNFSQTVMFIRRAERDPKVSKAYNEMKQSKVVFTEIDHNFVNPVSDEFTADIKEAFADRNLWVNGKRPGTSAYPSPYAVFNEYMTFGVFSLYCLDRFEKKEYDSYEPVFISSMENGRGFIRFGAFNNKLIEVYRQNPNANVRVWYKAMLAWAKTQK